ncbi:MAG: hypothetical protein LH631_14040 [Alkalinema sp. CAN_BIN05]|nr:hypothetical protein [Alkalinema sp. CAN_BIN05]
MSPIKQRLLTAIEQTPEPLLEQTLKFLENLLDRTSSTSTAKINFDPDTDSTAQIMADLKESLRQAQAGQTYPIAELWDGMNV